MTDSDRIGWYTIAVLVALSLGFVMASCIQDAHAGAPTLRETIIASAPSLSSAKEPTIAPDVLADAVLSATTNRQWAAFLLTVASYESALSVRIARSECGPHECDHGRAWGTWQQHRYSHNDAVWGSDDLNVQAREFSHLAHGYFNMCKSSGVPFPLSTFRALGGMGCKMHLPGEEKRVATFERLMRRL